MNRIPFSVYDFFGYLASGFLFLISVDYVLGARWVLSKEVTVALGLVGIVLAYIIGHIIANLSAWLLEGIVVEKRLRLPTKNLLSKKPRIWWTKFFPGYFNPLSLKIRTRVLRKAKAEGIPKPRTERTLYEHVYGIFTTDETTMTRVDIFLNLYGFCRNVSFTLLIIALVIVFNVIAGGHARELLFALVAVVASIFMFYRYLKFYRQYTYELLVTYAAIPSNKLTRDDD